MNKNLDDLLKLDHQLCFPLYAASKEIIRKYKPFLDKLDLTYTQYIALLVLWEKDNILVKDLGMKLYLDSGTLTPLLKKLESKGYIHRSKGSTDEREVYIYLTDKGRDLKKEAYKVPISIGSCIPLSKEESTTLYILLYKVLMGMPKKD